jgi:quinol monooxygenase YgiN
MIVITGSVVTTPATRAAIEAECVAHSQRSRAEPGCIAHNVHTDCENPDRLVFLELWADAAAVRAHFAVPASGAFVRSVSALAAKPPEMTLFRAEEVSPTALA